MEAFLHFEDDEGLSLLWYTPLQEDSEDLDDLRRTPISNLITKVEYVYWDERFEKWETETEPKEESSSPEKLEELEGVHTLSKENGGGSPSDREQLKMRIKAS